MCLSFSKFIVSVCVEISGNILVWDDFLFNNLRFTYSKDLQITSLLSTTSINFLCCFILFLSIFSVLSVIIIPSPKSCKNPKIDETNEDIINTKVNWVCLLVTNTWFTNVSIISVLTQVYKLILYSIYCSPEKTLPIIGSEFGEMWYPVLLLGHLVESV